MKVNNSILLTPIRFYRLSKGFEAFKVAQKVSISPSLLSKIETGKCNGSKKTRVKLAKVLGVKEKILFGQK